MTEKQALVKRTMTNSIMNLSGFVVSVLVALVLIPFIVDHIGLEKYGIYGLFIALLGPLGITNIGFNQASIKYISEYQGKGDYEQINRYFQTNLSMVLGFGLLGSILIYFFGFDLIRHFFLIDPEDHELIQNCLMYVTFMWFIGQLNNVLSAIPIAFQRFVYLGIGNILLTLINAGLVVVLIGRGLEGLLLAYCIGNGILLFIWIIFIKRISPQIRFGLKIHKGALKKTSVFAGWQTLGQLGAILSQQAEKYIIGALFSKVTLGIYIIAHDLHAKLYMPIYKLFEVLFPLFSSMSSGDDQSVRRVILSKSSWFANTLAAIIMIPFIPIAKSFLTVWISEEVAISGSPILIALLISAAVSACSLPLIMYFTGNAKTRFIAATTIVGGIISVSISWVLLRKFDITYAGYGALAAFTLRHLIYIVRIKLLEPKFAVLELINVTIIPILASLTLNLVVGYYWNPDATSWIEIIVYYGLMVVGSIAVVLFAVLLTDNFSTRMADFKTLLKNSTKRT